jgi:cyclohexa-1,5-dienecarbonyl-CoA hydratase
MLEDELNARGGIKGRDGRMHPVKIVIYDDGSDETRAVLAARKLIDEDRVAAIVGPTLTGTSLAILDTVRKAEVPMVSVAAASKVVEPVAERKWAFKTPQSDFLIVGVLVDYLKSKGLTRVGWLNVDFAFGQLGWIEFEKAARKAGLQIVANEKYGQKDLDMTAQLARVKAASPQAVVVWSIPPSASIATRNFADLGLRVPLLQSHGIGNRRDIELAGSAANGVVFPAGKLLVAEYLADGDPQKGVLLAYAKEFEAKYGPRNTFGGHAWHAVQIVASRRPGGPGARRRATLAVREPRGREASGRFDRPPDRGRARARRGVDAMSEYRFIRFVEQSDVVRLMLARPPLNMLTIDMMGEINDALGRAAAKGSLKVLVLAGEGKAFSAGVAVEDHMGDRVKPMLEAFHRIFWTLRALESVTVAAVQGAALGGGAELATFCDLVAADTATFGQPEVKVGVFPPIATLHYPHRVGLAHALRLILSGEVIGAAEAERIGLADRAVPAARLAEAVDAEVERFRAQSAVVLRLGKRAVRESLGLPFGQALSALEELYRFELMTTEDAAEGLRAFVEKRKNPSDGTVEEGAR